MAKIWPLNESRGDEHGELEMPVSRREDNGRN